MARVGSNRPSKQNKRNLVVELWRSAATGKEKVSLIYYKKKCKEPSNLNYLGSDKLY